MSKLQGGGSAQDRDRCVRSSRQITLISVNHGLMGLYTPFQRYLGENTIYEMFRCRQSTHNSGVVKLNTPEVGSCAASCTDAPVALL